MVHSSSKRRVRQVAAIVLVCTAWFCEPAQAKRRIPSQGEFRLRAAIQWGQLSYRGLSYATNARTDFDSNQPGYRLEGEFWFGKNFGLIASGTSYYMGVAGRPVYYSDAEAFLGWRIFGHGGAMNSETVLFVGPSLHFWPDIRSYVRQTIFDLVQPRTLGAMGGMRWRFAAGPKAAIELGGHYAYPMRIAGMGDVALVKTNTRNIGGWIRFDYDFYDGMGMGTGFHYQRNRLTYIPNGGADGFHQVIDIDVTVGEISLRFYL